MAAKRRRYVVAYDIRDPVRLRKVHRTMKEFGWAMQYSVFVSDLDTVELVQLKQALGAVIKHTVDSIAFIDCGDPEDRGVSSFSFMGSAVRLPMSGPLVL